MKLKTTFALASLGLLLMSCMKPPQINTDFGTEADGNAVQNAIQGAQIESTQNTVTNIQANEFVYFEKTSQIENLSPIVVRQRADTVATRTEDNKKIQYVINHELRELDKNGNMKPSINQSNACLEKVHGACDASTSSLVVDVTKHLMDAIPSLVTSKDTTGTVDVSGDRGFMYADHLGDMSWQALVKKAKANGGAGGPIQWKYYNLKRTDTTTYTPWLVSQRHKPFPECGGRTKSCDSPMQVIQISFDEVDWSSEKYPVKYTYTLGFSPEAPFFAAQLMSCGSTTIPYQTERLSILQCETVKDFTTGYVPAP